MGQSGIAGPAKAAPVPGQRELSLHGATAAMPVLPPCFWLVSATGASKISLNFEINSPESAFYFIFKFYLILLLYFIQFHFVLERLADLFEKICKCYLISILITFGRINLLDYFSLIYKKN